jgi:hypothetical protein
MSHISKIELEVKDLSALKQACRALNLKFCDHQEHFQWYGQTSQCQHAIQAPGAKYEIGVVKHNDLWELNCDYYDAAIEKAIGRQGGWLKQAYAVAKTRIEARKKAYTVMERKTPTGIRLHVRLT